VQNTEISEKDKQLRCIHQRNCISQFDFASVVSPFFPKLNKKKYLSEIVLRCEKKTRQIDCLIQETQ